MYIYRFDSMNPDMVGVLFMFNESPIVYPQDVSELEGGDDPFIGNVPDMGLLTMLAPYAWENGGNMDALWMTDTDLDIVYPEMYQLYCFEPFAQGLGSEPNRVTGPDAEYMFTEKQILLVEDLTEMIAKNELLKMRFPTNAVSVN